MRRPHPPLAPGSPDHPRFSRRSALQAGAIGLLGLDLGRVAAARTASGSGGSVIYVFLSGGLSQIDSLDPKPKAPAEIRGEFSPIATATPGLFICEHLPRLAARSRLWSVVRSLTHPSNDHSAGHAIMLTGRTDLPPGFDPNAPRPTDWPSLAALAGVLTTSRNGLPPAAVLPERIVHNTGRVIPGQFAGVLGSAHDPWFLEISPFEPRAYGAYPTFEFDHQQRPYTPRRTRFEAPDLRLPEGLGAGRFAERMRLLAEIDGQRRVLDRAAASRPLDEHRRAAAALLTDPRVRDAFDLDKTDRPTLDRYGDNAFGWSLLMARRLVEAGVRLVQVNLGNNETWDNHGFIFPNLKEKLLPPTDQALSALLDDLNERGLLDSTLVVVAGEFGRTPRISTLPQYYRLPGRDHWGRVQSVLIAGGGTVGGRIVGSSDRIGGFPASEPCTPEDLSATIFRALGIAPDATWHDPQGRPQAVYLGQPIAGLF
jgi:uncharacterized protein (DUF1501 family)